MTRELDKLPRAQGFIWRLSLADVDSDGPFSRFEGMWRILTVVEGKGMELVSPSGTLQADFAVPVEFDGAVDISARLKAGPLRDLNLIFDARTCSAKATVLTRGENPVLHCAEGQVLALHCMGGVIALNTGDALHKGDTLVMKHGTCAARFDNAATAVLVTITAHDKTLEPAI